MLLWFITKFRPFSTHMFNNLASKTITLQKTHEEKKQLAESVRNDMEHLRQGFKVLNDNMTDGFICCSDTITFVDIMIYVEISQVLCTFAAFVEHDTSDVF